LISITNFSTVNPPLIRNMDKSLRFARPYLLTLNIAYDDYMELLYRAKLLPNARLHGDHFTARKIIRAGDRKEAVRKTVQWFWKQFKGSIGEAHNVLTINDPYDEVVYSKKFSCADPANKYLDDETIEKVITGSGGKLMKETRQGTPHHPPNSLRRVKRRRKYHRTVAPRISISSSGAYYFRLTLRSQVSKKGEILQKRKIQNLRLRARNLEDAEREVIERGLAQ
jgi:hypothetical protein